jgi:hypothetical protein
MAALPAVHTYSYSGVASDARDYDAEKEYARSRDRV